MKIVLKILIFALFTFVLSVCYHCVILNGESISNCDELQFSQEHKSGRDTITKCGYDGDEQKTCCSPSEIKTLPTKSALNRRKDLEHMQNPRCNDTTLNSIYCDLKDKVTPDPWSSVISSGTTVPTNSPGAEFKYSEQCTISNQKLGEIKSDEASYTMTHCCGIESSSGNKIYGGNETAIDEYPWLAMLEYERPFLCGGTLISSFFVLTAAHCLVTETIKPRGIKSVRLGEYNTKTDGRDCVEAEGDGLDCTDGAVSITISNIIVHPQYNNVNTIIVQANDIGLLRLSQSSPYTDFIRPICLPSSDVTKMSLSLEFRFHVAGWGEVSDYQQRSDVKLQVELPIIDQKVCEKLYSLNGKSVVWEKQFCAGGEANKDTCKGDSGGPLIYSDEESKIHQIIGITSFGILKCGRQGRPSIYTKVIEYVPWIIANTNP